MRHPLLAVVVSLSLSPVALAQGKNLLFYGNSFSFFNGGVAQFVWGLAIEAGYPAPTYQEALVSGQDLHFHATDPGQIAAIGNFLPAGQTWDVVIMQGLSTEATTTQGNPTQFAADAVTILSNVRAHSPAAKGVLYQTFARAQGHYFYPGTYPNPLAMHDEVRSGYRNAVPVIEAVHGAGAVVNSAVGDCAALFEFDPAIYNVDLHHPGYPLTVMAGMCLFTSIYAHRVCDITPDFVTPSPLGALLLNHAVGPVEWRRLAGIADACAARGLRVYPGSGDHLLLEASTQPGVWSACPRTQITNGTPLELRLQSRNGVYDLAPAALLVDLFPTGQPPLPFPLLPELEVELGSTGVLLEAPDLTSPLGVAVVMPFTLPGLSVLVQGIALGPSGETGNAWFTTTEGLELVFY